jgi:CheY-like chemotaxis protein
VGVESVPGKGASFYFDLPCDDATQKIPATRLEPKKNKPHLLIIEDDAGTAEILATALAAQDYDVYCAATGQSALEHLQLRDYDLITLDLHLPDMNGIAIVEHIQLQESLQLNGEKKLPIIIITGAIDEEKKYLPSLAYREDVFWLQKPLVNGQLEYVIAQALAKLAADTAGATR